MRQLVLVFCTLIASFAHAQDWTGSGEVDYTALSYAQQLKELRPGTKPDATLIRMIFDSSQIMIVKKGTPVSWNRGQGLKVDDWNLEALRGGYKAGLGLTLDHLLSILYLAADGADGKMPEMAKVDPIFRKKFLADLKRMTELSEMDQTGLRFMSHLIVLIGLNSERPYDLLDPEVSGNVRLDPVQSFLLLHRMSAELHVFARKFRPASLRSSTLKSLHSMQSPNAACEMTEIEGLIMDAASSGTGVILGGTQFFKGALELLADAKWIDDVGLEKYQKATLVANVISNYLKLFITMASFESEVTQGPAPLVRTKNKTSGANGKVNGRFWLDVGDIQFVNCIRPALNMFGVDFSVPQSGALAGVRAEWAINSRVGAENDVIQTYDVDPLRQVTDADGKSFIKIQGKPQKKDLTGKKLLKVDRYVPVNVAVNLKNNNMGQDLIDLSGGVGGVSALWSLPTELLNRIPFLFNRTIMVKVTDWKELEGDHFQIMATYSSKDISQPWDAFIRKISDRMLIDIEVKVFDRLPAVASVLSIEDDQTSYNLEYADEFWAGEGCRSKRYPLGRYEVFTSLPSKTEVNAVNMGDKVKVLFKTEVIREYNGWKYAADHPSCQLTDINPYATTYGVPLYLEFDSTQLSKIGQTIQLDRRDSAGEGWIYVITYVE